LKFHFTNYIDILSQNAVNILDIENPAGIIYVGGVNAPVSLRT